MEQAALLTGMARGSILIRPYLATDVDRLFDAVAASRARLGAWMPWCHAKYARSDSETWIASRAEAWARSEAFDFVIIDDATDVVLGACGLNDIHRERRAANLGYWVRADANGRGIATTAAWLLARFGFVNLGLQRIEIVAAVENLASQRVAAKVGATREGVLRNRILLRDAFHDAVVFSLVPGDLA